MSLSDKKRYDGSLEVYEQDNVRDFIRELKEELINEGFVSRADKSHFHKIIDELAGEKLI